MNISKNEKKKLLKAKAMVERELTDAIERDHAQNVAIQTLIDIYGDDGVIMEFDLNDLESGITCIKLKDLI